MPASEMTHADWGRESTHAQQHQGKAWATKAQQDLPVNVAINSQLLAYKAKKDRLYNCTKTTLRVDPYFHV
jgi:hypothetical protein